MIFVCDTSDENQNLRMRLFNQWFLSGKNPDLKKFDYVIEDGYVFLSVILNKNNTNYQEVIDIANGFYLDFKALKQE